MITIAEYQARGYRFTKLNNSMRYTITRIDGKRFYYFNSEFANTMAEAYNYIVRSGQNDCERGILEVDLSIYADEANGFLFVLLSQEDFFSMWKLMDKISNIEKDIEIARMAIKYYEKEAVEDFQKLLSKEYA